MPPYDSKFQSGSGTTFFCVGEEQRLELDYIGNWLMLEKDTVSNSIQITTLHWRFRELKLASLLCSGVHPNHDTALKIQITQARCCVCVSMWWRAVRQGCVRSAGAGQASGMLCRSFAGASGSESNFSSARRLAAPAPRQSPRPSTPRAPPTAPSAAGPACRRRPPAGTRASGTCRWGAPAGALPGSRVDVHLQHINCAYLFHLRYFMILNNSINHGQSESRTLQNLVVLLYHNGICKHWKIELRASQYLGQSFLQKSTHQSSHR